MAKTVDRKHAYMPMVDQSMAYEPFSMTSLHHGYYGYQCHDFFEFYLFFEGADYYCIDQEVYALEPNTLIIIPPFVMHALIGAKTPTSYRRAWLYVTVPMLQTIGCGMLDLAQYLRECVRQGKGIMNIGAAAAEYCRDMIEEIAAGMADQSTLGRWKNTSLVSAFIRALCTYTERELTQHTPVVLDETMQRVLIYINGHFTEPLQLSELARQFGVSVSYLSHEFIYYTGRSLYDYILYSRIQLAKRRIYDGEAFTQTAYACGFNDYSGFLRAFCKACGMTPSQYRKSIAAIGGASLAPFTPIKK